MNKVKFLFSLALLMVCGNAIGANVLSVKSADGEADLTVAPGESVEAVVYLENSGTNLTTFFQVNIDLPEGFEIDGTPTFNQERSTNSGVKVTWNATKKLMTGTNEDYWDDGLKGTSGELFRFKIKASSATEQTDPYKISLTNFKISNDEFDDETASDLNVNVYVKAAATTVDITLANTDSYNSYCCDKDLDVSGVTDAEFYVVSSVTASEATLTKVTSGIPAGEGFLIKGTGTANISVPVAATAPTATGSKLVGVTAATDIEAGNYILKSDGSSFVPCTAGTLPANKAYLKKDDVPASAKEFLMIVDDAVVTGINEVQAENSVNGPIYNLNGARVSNPQKGVYIMNGRKVIVK